MPIVRIAIAILAAAQSSWAAAASIQLEGSAFKVIGWNARSGAAPEGWSAVFQVFAGTGDVPAVLGSYTVDGDILVFRPRFPLVAGVQYRAVFRPPEGAIVEALFEGPKSVAQPSTRVDHVYPTANVLPDNQLKFYIQLSAPMRRGDAWRHIHLLDALGSAVELPFLELDQELWDRDYQRLTVLFDPGRIKRGLVPREQAGPNIEAGKQYTLVIDEQWLDANSQPLREEFRKEFRVGPADRTPPDPKQWKLSPPPAGTRKPVVVEFLEPMDYALLMRTIAITGSAGTLRGTEEIDDGETRWSFVPLEPWKRGEYRLMIDTSLEDLAGNRIGRAFDVDVFDRVSEHIERKTVSVSFRVR